MKPIVNYCCYCYMNFHSSLIHYHWRNLRTTDTQWRHKSKFGPLWQKKYDLAVPKNLGLVVEQWRQFPHRASVVLGGTEPLELHLQKQAMCTIWNSCKNKMPIWLKKANKGGSYNSWYTGFTFTCQVFTSFSPLSPITSLKPTFFQTSKTFCWNTQRASILMHWVWIYYLDSTSVFIIK